MGDGGSICWGNQDCECYTSGTCDVVGAFRRGVCDNPDYQSSQQVCELYSVWNTDEEICVGWRYANSNGHTTVPLMGKIGDEGETYFYYMNTNESAYIKVYDSSNGSILDLNPSAELPDWEFMNIFQIHGTSTACNGGDEIDNCGICSGSFGGHEANSDVPDGDCDCNGHTLDECGVCGGGGIPEGDCDCFGNVLDTCGICNGEEECFIYSRYLYEGANLVSFWALPEDTSIANVMSSLGTNVAGVIGEGVAATQISPFTWLGSLASISYTSGYWVILDNETAFTLEGYLNENTVYDLYIGANLISYPFPDTMGVTESIPDIMEGYFTGIIGEGVAATQIEPFTWIGSLSEFKGGNGYWVEVIFPFEFSFTNPDSVIILSSDIPKTNLRK